MLNKYHAVENATPEDLPFICQLFDRAIAFQKSHNYIGWNNYDINYIRTDIDNKLLFKILQEQNIICIFSICFTDELIWREKEKGDAVYLHRIVINPAFKGRKLFGEILNWAIEHASNRGLRFVRMDTWANNHAIINYYKTFGFKFLGNMITPDTPELPVHNRKLALALLEIELT